MSELNGRYLSARAASKMVDACEPCLVNPAVPNYPLGKVLETKWPWFCDHWIPSLSGYSQGLQTELFMPDNFASQYVRRNMCLSSNILSIKTHVVKAQVDQKTRFPHTPFLRSWGLARNCCHAVCGKQLSTRMWPWQFHSTSCLKLIGGCLNSISNSLFCVLAKDWTAGIHMDFHVRISLGKWPVWFLARTNTENWRRMPSPHGIWGCLA